MKRGLISVLIVIGVFFVLAQSAPPGCENVCADFDGDGFFDPNSPEGCKMPFFSLGEDCDDNNGDLGLVCHATCEDSDGGVEIYEEGFVLIAKPGSSGHYYDICRDGSDLLYEWYCVDDETVRKEEVLCNNGCMNGACVEGDGLPGSKCADSDGGNDPYVRGSVSVEGDALPNEPTPVEVALDYCVDGTFLEEQTCGENDEIISIPYRCELQCHDGACLRKPSQLCDELENDVEDLEDDLEDLYDDFLDLEDEVREVIEDKKCDSVDLFSYKINDFRKDDLEEFEEMAKNVRDDVAEFCPSLMGDVEVVAEEVRDIREKLNQLEIQLNEFISSSCLPSQHDFDINKDGIVTTSDANEVLVCAADVFPVGECMSCIEKACDFNNNSQLEAGDAGYVYRAAREGSNDLEFDLNQDGEVTKEDGDIVKQCTADVFTRESCGACALKACDYNTNEKIDVDDAREVLKSIGKDDLAACGNEFIDVKSDNDNCGECGYQCEKDSACVEGICEVYEEPVEEKVCALYFRTDTSDDMVQGTWTDDARWTSTLSLCNQYMETTILNKPDCAQPGDAVFAAVVLVPKSRHTFLMPDVDFSKEFVSNRYCP